MERIHKRPAFVDYQDALEGFTQWRKKLNDDIENPKEFQKDFSEVKKRASQGDTIAMDVLAYYYKSGVQDILPENYNKYIKWEILSASRGNELAIEKLQFLLGFAYTALYECEDYDEIVYKNDIDEYNEIYVLGKNICKMLTKEMQIFLSDLSQEEDSFKPYTQEAFILFRKAIENVIPKTIEFMKS